MTVQELLEELVSNCLVDEVNVIIDAMDKIPELKALRLKHGRAATEGSIYHAMHKVTARKISELAAEVRKYQRRF